MHFLMFKLTFYNETSTDMGRGGNFISKTDDKMSEGFIGYKKVKQPLYQVQTFTVKLLKGG